MEVITFFLGICLFTSYANAVNPVLPNGVVSIVDTTTNPTTVYTLAATDADVGDTLTYAMTVSSNYFELSGQAVNSKAGIPADNYTLTFRVMDSTGNIDTASVDITVTNSITQGSAGETTPSVLNAQQMCITLLQLPIASIMNMPVPSITNMPIGTTVYVGEDTIDEDQIFLVEYTDASLDDYVDCTVQSSTPASNDFFVRYDSTNNKYGVYVQRDPTLTAPIYTLIVACTDQNGGENTGSLTVNVTGNEPPTFNNLAGIATIAGESSPIGTVVFTVTSTDTDSSQLFYNCTTNPVNAPFQVLNDGRVLLSRSILGDTQPNYNLSIYVYDGYNLVGPDILTITVSDINNAPTFDNLDGTANVDENSASGTSVFQVSATDVDAGQTLIYSASYNPGWASVYFTINANTGLITTDGQNLNREAIASNVVTASVSVTDGASMVTGDVVMTVDGVNESPTFQKTSYPLTCPEGQAGTYCGIPPFVVNDEDVGDAHTYTFDCATQFSMDANTMAVSLRQPYDIDVAGTPSEVTCVTTVSDSAISATTNLVIAIENINDNTPSFDSTSYTFYLDSSSTIGSTVGSLNASDGDVGDFGSVSYMLDSSADAAYFGIHKVSGLGQLYVRQDIDSLGNGGRTLTFLATTEDGGSLSANAVVQVIIPATTTTSTTTTTDRHIGFIDTGENVAWLASFCGVGALLLGLLVFMAYRHGFFTWFVDKIESLCDRCRPGRKEWDLPEEDYDDEYEDEYRYTPPRQQKVATIGGYTGWNAWKNDGQFL